MSELEDRGGSGWAAWVLPAGAAVVVAVEFIVVGIAPAMARDMKLTAQQAGWFVTCFALGSTVMGPIVAVAMRHPASDRAMIFALLPFSGNLLVPLLRDPMALYALRIAQGATLPLFIVVASDALARLSGNDARAAARIYLGVTLGGLFGVPAGVAIADGFGWPAPLQLFGALAAVVALIIARLRSLRFRTEADSRPADVPNGLPTRRMALHLMLSFIQFAAMFSTFAFLGTILLAAEIGNDTLAFWLLLFGVAGLAGNMLGGYAAARSVERAAIAIALLIAVPAMAVQVLPLSSPALMLLLILWGAAHAAAFVICQIRVSRAAPRAPRLAATLNISAANLGIALGSAVGGWSLASSGIAAMGATGLCLSLLALFIALMIGRESMTAKAL